MTYPTYDNNTVTGTKTAGTLKVRAMTMDDIKKATGLNSISGSTSLEDARYQKLFDLGVFYWLASANDDRYLWYMRSNGNVDNYYYGSEYGVRPIISLKPEIKTKGTNIKGAWNIEI